MKTNRSKQHTIETLSVYLDGQLSERETEILRQQLEKDAALRSQLEDLRQTRYVLQQTPKLKRRRSFVLSPEMVKKQKIFFRAMNVSRAISAAASVLLVAALGSQYLIGGGQGLASTPMMNSANYEMADEIAAYDDSSDGVAEEPAMAMEAPVEEAPEAPMAELEVEATPDGFAKTDTSPSVMADEPADDAENAVAEAESTSQPAGTGADLPVGGGGEPPTDEGDAKMGDAPATATMEGTERSFVPDKDAGEELGEAIPQDMPDEEQVIPTEELDLVSDPPRAISPLRVAQGILLLLAIAGGLTAAFFRKKVR